MGILKLSSAPNTCRTNTAHSFQLRTFYFNLLNPSGFFTYHRV